MHVIDLSVTIHDKQGRLGLSAEFDTPFKFSEGQKGDALILQQNKSVPFF